MRAAGLVAGFLLLTTSLSCRGASEDARHAPTSTGTPAAVEAEVAGSVPGAPTAWEMPVPALGYSARQGRALFLHYCSTCHGAEGHGDGFNAFNLDPKPRDLADPAFQQQRTDEDLAAAVRAGGGAAGLSTGMPPWGRTLDDRQIEALVRFLRTLKPRQD